MSKAELYLSGVIKYGLYAILLTPLAFWPGALYGFLTPKFLVFQVLVEIVFGAWLILKIISFRSRIIKPNFRSPTSVASAEDVGLQELKLGFKNWLVIALVSFFTVSFISALFGVDFSRSFWGIGARMTGLFAELHFLAWFLVLVNFSKSGFDIKKYLNFSFAVCVVVALTAFYQNTQWHLVSGYTIFSNPTFVAPYFLFHFFWGIYKSIGFRNLYFLGGTVLIGIALVMGQVRGAIIGLLVGLFVVGVFLIFSDILAKKRYKLFIAALMLVIILSVSAIFVFKDSEFIKSRSYLDRIGSISLSAATAQTRILTWQSAIKGFSSAPILGAGPENFSYLFNANYNPRLLMYGGGSFAETWQDKPHNAFIEILTETGIIGSLSYILIWLAVGLALFKLFKSNQKLLSLILFSAFVAYFGAIFFSFDSFGSWFGLYLFLALLILS